MDHLLVPTRYTVYEVDRSEFGTSEIRGWSLTKPFDEDRMVRPSGAVLDKSIR
ncbi:MAG: hypothetical protein ACYS0G_08215 [Planctomycetota bacterium]